MVTKEEILTFFEANPQLKKESLYQNYSIMDYSYDSNQKKHRLTINPYYEIEKSGDLHSDLYKLIFSEKRDIVYFWTKDKPNAGKLFTFVGKDRYYWTIFPKWDFFESQEAQEWLDKTYPPEKRSNYTYLDISNKNLKGNLKLEGFINISFLNCSQNLLTNLDLSENVKLTELKCQNNELVSLDLSQNKKLVNLNCYANKLIEIILSNEELTRVDCSNNLLTNLDLNNCNNLESLKVHNYEQGHESFNELSNVNFLNQLPNPKKLKILWLYANNIQSDLTLFSSFASLEDLDLGMNNFSEEFTKKRGNKFHGSLEPLKNLTKLKKLDISNTDIENGLEHLPASVEEISCAIRERPESKVKEIVKQLNSSLLINENRNKYYLAEKWKNIHEGFVSTPWFRNDWEEWGFTYKDCKEWISAGLSPSDANFARYLRKQGRAREKGLNLSEIKILRGEYDIYLKNLEQEWKGLNYHSSTIISLIKKGFDYKEFEQWIKLGFKIEEVWQIKEWKKHNFNIDQIKKWNNVGLGVKEVELASYLQQKGFSYQITKDKVESLRKEFQKIKVYFNWKYPTAEEKSSVEYLTNIGGKNLEGNLDLREFINLKQLVCSNNKITSLNLRGLNKLELVYCSNNQLAGISLSENPKLIQIDCRDNKLTKLNLNGCDNLTSINCQDNQLINLNISNCPKLTWLECLNNPLTVENLNISNCPKLNKSNIKWTTQVQDWLDWNYPKETRKEVEKLDISGNLEGNLKLEGFFNLKTLFTRDNKLNNLDIRDCFSLEWLNCSNNLLVILDLSNNYQLTTIYCGNCKIKELKLSNYPKLKEFDCSNNYLTGLNWDAFNPETLERINVAGNNFKRDLNCFSKFINLKSLRIGDSYLIFSSSSRKDFCDNLFYGSLKPLENLTKLETLDIGNTDIDSGLEYLPNNIHTISCLVSREPATKVKILAKQIEPFGPSAYANLRSWKEVNKEKIQLFLVSDKLSELVENKIKNFFARWSKYLSKEQEMIKSQKWTDYCWRFKWTSVVGGLVSSSLSLNANLLEQSAGFALGGIALGALGDYGVKKTEKKIKELESILNIKEEEFKQEIKMLKKNYNELLEIWRELSILSRTPTNFESTDSAFNEFLSVIAELKNQTRPSFHKQLSNDEIVLDVFDETEQTLEEIKKNKEFAQSLLVNWNKCQVSKSTTNLIQEINNYRQEFYDRNSTGELGKNIYSAPFILTTPVLDSQNWQPEPGSPLFLSKPGNEVYTYSRTQNRNIPLQILEWGDWKDLQKFKSDHQNKSVKLEKVPPSPLLFNSGQQISQEIKEKANTERQSVELPNISSKFTSQLVTQLQNLNFASDLITHWTTLNFTPPQVKDWLSIGLQPTDSHLAAWLRDELRLTPEQLLNDHTTNLADLREQFTEYQTYQEQPPKN